MAENFFMLNRAAALFGSGSRPVQEVKTLNRRKSILYFFFFIPVMVLFMGDGPDAYAASSTNYAINTDVIDGGGGSSSSSNYQIEQSIGQTSPIGTSSSSNYNAFAGYYYAFSVTYIVDFSSSTSTYGTTSTGDTTPTWTWTSGGGTGIFRYKLGDSDLTSGATDNHLHFIHTRLGFSGRVLYSLCAGAGRRRQVV